MTLGQPFTPSTPTDAKEQQMTRLYTTEQVEKIVRWRLHHAIAKRARIEQRRTIATCPPTTELVSSNDSNPDQS